MMKNLKKFFVFAIATAIVAGAVFAVTPNLKTLAAVSIRCHESAPGVYVEASDGECVWDGTTYTEYIPSSTTPTPTPTPTPAVTPTPVAATKQNATPAKSSSAAVATTDLSKPGAEVVLPASITTSDGKPIAMFTSTDGSQTMMAGAVGLIPSGSKLQAIEAAPTSQTFSVAKAILAAWRPNAEVKKVYDFNVFSKQATLIKNLDGKICMSLPMPADLTVPEGMVLKVYKFNDDGSITVCETLIDQGRVVWGTDSFGTFAFAVEKPVKARR